MWYASPVTRPTPVIPCALVIALTRAWPVSLTVSCRNRCTSPVNTAISIPLLEQGICRPRRNGTRSSLSVKAEAEKLGRVKGAREAVGLVGPALHAAKAALSAMATVLRMPGIDCFFQAKDGIRYLTVTGVQTCALPI